MDLFMRIASALLAAALMGLGPATGEPLSETESEAIIANVETKYDVTSDIARKLWEWAEVGYQEERSSKLMQDTLARRGFSVRTGVCLLYTSDAADE